MFGQPKLGLTPPSPLWSSFSGGNQELSRTRGRRGTLSDWKLGQDVCRNGVSDVIGDVLGYWTTSITTSNQAKK